MCVNEERKLHEHQHLVDDLVITDLQDQVEGAKDEDVDTGIEKGAHLDDADNERVKTDRFENLTVHPEKTIPVAECQYQEEKKIKEINTGIYCVESPFLFKALMKINNNNAQKEYYLTDIVAVARQLDCRVGTLVAGDYREVMGINSREELERAHLFMRGRMCGRGSDDATW